MRITERVAKNGWRFWKVAGMGQVRMFSTFSEAFRWATKMAGRQKIETNNWPMIVREG